MMKLMKLGAVAMVAAACSFYAQAISLTPAGPGLVLWGDDSSQAAAQAVIDAAYPGLDLLYKGTRDGNNSAGVSSGPFASSYNTTFYNADLLDSDARITYVGPTAINSNPVYAYIKDGNASPNWYLFDISGWNGTETIEFSGFFNELNPQGRPIAKDISHVSIYGNQAVPDGTATLVLLGLGLVGVAGLRRSSSRD